MNASDACTFFLSGLVTGAVGVLIAAIACAYLEARDQLVETARFRAAYARHLYDAKYQAFLLGHSLGAERAFAQDTQQEIAYRIEQALRHLPR